MVTGTLSPFATIMLVFLLSYRALFLVLYYTQLGRRWSTTLLVLLLPFSGFMTGIIRDGYGYDFRRVRGGLAIIILSAVVFILITVEAGVNIFILLLFFHPEFSVMDVVGEIARSSTMFYIGVFMYGGLILSCLTLSQSPASLGWRIRDCDGKGALLGIAGAFLMLAILFAYSIILSLLFPDLKVPSNVPETTGSSDLLFLLFTASVMAPVGEETFFRGLLYETLKKRWGWVASALTTALLFSLAHLSPISLPPIFMGGIIMAFLKERTGWLLPPVITHSTYNAAIIIISLSL